MRKKELTNRANKKNKNIMKINTKERGLQGKEQVKNRERHGAHLTPGEREREKKQRSR